MSDLPLILSMCFLLGALVLGWRLIGVLQAVTRASHRAADRERRDLYQIFERMFEKRDTLPHQIRDLANLHARERMNQVTQDAKMEGQDKTPQNGEKNDSPDIIRRVGEIGAMHS